MNTKEWADLHGEWDMPRSRGSRLLDELANAPQLCELCGEYYRPEEMVKGEDWCKYCDYESPSSEGLS